MAVYQGRPYESHIYLELVGVPATSVAYNQVTVEYRKTGQTAFSVKTLAAADWVNLGDGFYVLKWSAADTSALGSFMFTLSGAGFDNFLYSEFDVDPVPLPLTVPANTCILSGNIVDIGGSATCPSKHAVTIRPATLPMQNLTSVVAGDQIRTIPDALGYFSVAVLRGKEVIIEVERTGIRVQVTIPDQPTALLTDLLV